MTPRRQRSSYTPEFRNQAARLVIESSRPAAEVVPTISHATKAIVKYIEIFYNRQRLHSGLGYRTPLDAQISYNNYATAA